MKFKKDAEGNFEVDGDIKFGNGFKEVEPLKTDMKDNLLTITGTNGFECVWMCRKQKRAIPMMA